MITIQKNDGTATEIPSNSENIGQVADARIRAEEDASAENTGMSGESERADTAAAPILPERKKPRQSDEENARYAAARRGAERQRDAEVSRVRAEADREVQRRVDAAIARLGQKNAEGRAITTEAEWNEYIEQTEKGAHTANAEEKVENTGIKEAQGNSSLDNAAARATELGERLMDEQTRMTVESEIGKVTEHFPEIKSLEDIVRLPRYAQIKSKVAQGYAISDAVRLVYEDVYVGRRAQAAAAQARQLASSTAHLTATRAQGSGSVNVTEAQIRTYMDAIPGSSRDQAINAYRKYKFGAK